MWWLYVKLFYSFFKIGLFGFGGGYAMISLIQGEVVNRYHWLTSGQFTDIVAISQMTPGPIGINSATYVGYTSVVNAGYGHGWAVLGSVTATFAVVLPSFILMLLISKFLMNMCSRVCVRLWSGCWRRQLCCCSHRKTSVHRTIRGSSISVFFFLPLPLSVAWCIR